MGNTRSIARLGVLAVGLGIGAAWAHTPVASADSSSDWLSTVDSLVSGLPAAPTPIDVDISFDGYTIYDGGGTAVANTGAAGNGLYDLAIAYGANSSATAEGGIGDYALASGTNALASAGSLTATGDNFDTAIDIGNNADPSSYPGDPFGAYAGGASLIGGTDTGTNSNDTAIDIGNDSPISSSDGGTSGAFAGDSGLIGDEGPPTSGSGDFASTTGNLEGLNDGSAAVGGNYDYASSTGSETGDSEGAFAAFGNNNTAIADANYTTNGDGAAAQFGNGNYAYVYGPDNSNALAGGDGPTDLGNNDVAYISDPFSSITGPADTATAGTSFSNDLAEVLFTHGTASADTANLLYDFVSLFGNFTGSL
ncbi:MAG: hypothetical protein WB777_25555 [Mycobacterium sp.]